MILISIFTDWPVEIFLLIRGHRATTGSKLLPLLQWVYVILRMLLATAGMVVLMIITFRRDRLDKASTSGTVNLPSINVELFQNKVSVTYNDTRPNPDGLQLFGDVIVLNLITTTLLLWVFYCKIRLQCKKKEKLPKKSERPDHEDTTAKRNQEPTTRHQDEEYILNHDQGLVNAVKEKPNISANISSVCTYLELISIIYIILSILVDVLYLVVYFKQKQFMWPAGWEITGNLKITIITILLVGDAAIDLLYIQIILRYVLQCQLNIYYLQFIIAKVEEDQYSKQSKAIDDVNDSLKFLKQLNRSSRITGLAIISALIQAINCAINLSNYMDNSAAKTNQSLEYEVVTLACRLFLWIFLTMVPFIQAARTNETIEALYDTGLAMVKSPVKFSGNTPVDNELIKENAIKITLNAKLFNVIIPPGFTYLTIIVLLLMLALKSAFQLYGQVL